MTVVLATAMNDQVLVSSRAELKTVDLGWPLEWVHQDQSSYDPPFPTHVGLSSPWENPTSVSGTAFLVDALIVFAVVAVVGLLLCAFSVALWGQIRSVRR